ncbi:MAG: oligosaccharide flippase family protein [Colwellia sp.]|nr:oligosaccharide flippase family protein [Colwellia sp.]
MSIKINQIFTPMYKTVFQSIIVSAVTVILGFIYSVLLARFLGPENRGIYGSILMIVALISSFSQFGLAQGYVYQTRMAQRNGFQLLIHSTVLISLSALIIAFITKVFLLPNELTGFFFIITLLSLVTSINSYFQNASQVEKKLYFYNTIKAFTPLVNILLLAGYYLHEPNIPLQAFINIILVSTLFSLLILSYNLLLKEKNSRIITPLKLINISKYSLKIYGTSLLGIFINNIDKIIILNVGTMKEFGLYGVAFGLSRLIGIIPETISMVIYSKFAGKSESELSLAVKTFFSFLFIPLMCVCIIIIMLSSWLIPVIFGNEYRDSILPFIFLTCECVISGLGWLLSQRFNASGRPGLVLFRQVISTVPLIYICFLSI